MSTLSFSALTDIGKKRSQNQDCFAVKDELGLFVVADGMGGHKGGETASLMATQIIPQVFAEGIKARPGTTQSHPLAFAIEQACKKIYQHSDQDPTLRGMGTTCTSLYFDLANAVLWIGHVGDSRCYLITRDQTIFQLTRDHSLVQEKLRSGIISRDQVKTDRMKNVITRSVGFEQHVQVDLYQYRFQPGDAFVICSDGLSGPVEDHQILETVLASTAESPTQLTVAQKLIDRANAQGGDDNITAIYIRVNL